MPAVPAKLTTIVQKAIAKHTATVIILHGFGDSGAGWQLKTSLPHVKFIFPNAPIRPVTALGGVSSTAWYDIYANNVNFREDEEGLLQARQQVMEIVREEVDQHGIQASRIVIGGFSQGCTMSLLSALTSEYRLGGILALSGYIPIHGKFMTMVADANRKTPIFWGHGDADQVVKYDWGERSVALLREHNYSVEFHTYPRMAHSACEQELKDIEAFLIKTIPQEMPILAKK
ncbi:Phospholipase/carboxylesterase [Mortierella sp. GBAus27b]|nr:Phospholipase/carboxylesterase [Mortierella sp. GBAus27b]